MLTRRHVLVSAIATMALPSLAKAQSSSNPAPGAMFKDLFNLHRGVGDPTKHDIEMVNSIVSSDYLPRNDPYEIMLKLSELGTAHRNDFKSNSGFPFNQRWPTVANPMIVKFFHDLGYSKLHYPNDCTPWCGATTGWCLKRAGYKVPSDPASSQSYVKNYGTHVPSPQHGDLCVFTDVGDSSHGHVGFFVSTDGGVLTVLGGNQTGHGATNCGRDYPQSEIGLRKIPINSNRDKKVGVHYLAAYVRPAT